ncbi:MAG: Gfo/Idh/MocA family protein [Cyanophyceae cyanobacterium]
MRIAIVGCGFVADYYLSTLPLHPELELVGVMDRNQERAARCAARRSLFHYRSLEELLADERVELVLNLTNPSSHFSVSWACLAADKHVYSEKPLGMTLAEAEQLVALAEQRGLSLASAPCNVLSETAQTVWKALREGAVGSVRLVYAEMDDGLVHRMPYQKWLSESGIPWPYKDEFEVGCTLEHAGYYITWLTAFFGPAELVTAFSSCLIPDKQTDVSLEGQSPDFSVACIKFSSGVVARLTCGIVAPHDHSLQVIGDEGILYTDDCWYYRSPVYIKRRLTIRRKMILTPWSQKVPLVGNRSQLRTKASQQMDYCRGVAELATAITEQRPCRLSAQYSLHINEIVLAIHNALETGSSYRLTSSFEPMEPMPWAK